jgi:stress response protein YsnF
LWQTIAENKSSKFRQLKERLKERKKWIHSLSFKITVGKKVLSL